MEIRDIRPSYQLQEVLSASPLSTVRRAVDPATGLVVVIKLLHSMGPPIDDAMRERYLATMTRLRDLAPAAFPSVADFGLGPDETAFVVMEHVDGVPLGTLGELAPARLMPLLEQVARAMEPLAAAGLSHHNLCPENILVAPGETGDTVRILGLGTAAYLADDSGVAPLGRSPEAERFTAAELLGPEAPDLTVAWRADVYSVALIACTLLHADVERAGSARPEVYLPAETARSLRDPTILAATLAVALRDDPHDRSLTFAELADAFAHVAPAPGAAPATSLMQVEGEAAEHDRAEEEALPPPAEVVRGRPRVKVRLGGRGVADEAPEAGKEEPAAVAARPGQENLADQPAEGGVESGESGAGAAFDPDKTDPMLSPPLPPESLPLPLSAPPEAEEILDTPEERPTPTADTGPVPVVPVVAPAEPVAETVVAAKAPIRPSRPHRRPAWVWLVAGLALVVVLGVVTVLAAYLLTPRVELGDLLIPTPAPPTPVPPTAIPVVTVNPQLQAAQEAFEDGDSERARQAFESIADDEVARFSPAETQLYAALQQELAGLTREQALDNLKAGLRSGDIRALRAASATLSALSAREVAAVPGLKADLDRTREALRVHTLMWRAQRANDPLETLQRAAELVYLLPTYGKAAELRDEAGRQVMELARQDLAAQRYDRATARLEAVQRSWPEAPDVAAALARVKHEKAVDERLRSVLAAAAAQADGETPEKGLDLLAGVTPSERYAAAFQETAQRLKSRLAEIDAKPPTVVIPPGFDFKYKKNEVILVPVQISDDHGVVSARAMVRTESRPEYRQVALKHTEGDRYVMELPPAVHGNETVEFYVVASDASGHTTSLGTGREPIQIKRKRWFGF